MRYKYLINNKIMGNSLAHTNEIIKNMSELPQVTKIESFPNGAESRRNIKVKRNANNYFTIS